ncbi:MAG TPA: SWIM zinc finger family protein [Isosphaeraceae bacterium]|nr:SWIM zinc finger family protein [Isosphaeraceae bacterium]
MIDCGRQTPAVPAGEKLGRLWGIQEAWIKAAPSAQSQRLVRDRDESDPYRCAVELAQRGRMIVDVAAVDLEAAEAAFGPFHPTTWHFRNALNEARRSWERLRAELGTKVIDAALREPPLTVLTLGKSAQGSPQVVLVSIAGQTYRTEQVMGTEVAPIQWRLTRLLPPLDHGPYYVCRLADGLTQCDCADWTYQIAQSVDSHRILCKHLAALSTLGWI